MAEEGNGDVGGDAGLPEGRGSVGRKRGSRRSSQAQRGVEGETVAAALRWSGCARRVRESRGEEGVQRERGAVRRGVVASPGRRGGSGKQEVAGTRAGALRPHTLVPTGTRLRMTGTWAWWAGFSAGPGK